MPRSPYRLPGGLAMALLALLSGPVPMVAQIRVNVEVEHESVLPNEPVSVIVTMVNDADTPLVFGEDNYNAQMILMLERGVRRTEERIADTTRPVKRHMIVMPGETHRELFELTSLFNMHEQRTYRVHVVIEHEDLRYRSRDRVFEVANGVELHSAVHPVPGYRDRRLTYSLRYWRRNQSEHLFLVVSDEANDIAYGSFDLGRLVRFRNPTLRYDRSGQIMVIHQSGRERFTRSLFAISGEGVDFVEQEHFLSDGTVYPFERPVGVLRDRPLTER